MPIEQNSIKSELYDFLKGQGLKPKRLDSSGKIVPTTDDAEVFQAHWHKDDEDYGTISIALDGLQHLTVYYNDEVADSPSGEEEGDSSWTTFLKQLKKFAQNRQLSFKLDNTDNLGDEMQKREKTKKDELNEGWTGNKHTSVSDNPGPVKIILKHTKRMEESDQRFRHIDTIFVENSDGERFKLPTKKTSEARAFARHIAEGGLPNDERWNHVKQLCEERSKLAKFVRATKSGQFNESVGRLINEATEYYHNIGETIKKISGSRGYDSYFESWTPTLMEADDDTNDLSEMFMTSRLDERIAEALPILKRFGKISEMSEIDAFESWASGVIDDTLYEGLKPATRRQEEELVKLLNDESFTVGPDGRNAIGMLSDLIEDDDLYDELRTASYADADNDARPIVIAWMEQRADEPVYDKVLAKLGEKPAEEPASETPPAAPAPAPEAPPELPPLPEPGAEEPPLPGEAPAGDELPGLPELPPLPGEEGEENAELPELPPLKEEDDYILRLKRLSGLSKD